MVLCYKCKHHRLIIDNICIDPIITIGFWCDKFQEFLSLEQGQDDLQCDGYEHLDSNDTKE